MDAQKRGAAEKEIKPVGNIGMHKPNGRGYEGCIG